MDRIIKFLKNKLVPFRLTKTSIPLFIAHSKQKTQIFETIDGKSKHSSWKFYNFGCISMSTFQKFSLTCLSLRFENTLKVMHISNKTKIIKANKLNFIAYVHNLKNEF